MKNIINNLYYKERNTQKPALYKNISNNNYHNFINKNRDKRRLLHFSLMEFLKNNYKKSICILLGEQNNKKNNNTNINSKSFFSINEKKVQKKIHSNHSTQKEFFITSRKNIENEISIDGQNSLWRNKCPNSFIHNLYNTKIKRKEKNSIKKNYRIKSCVEKNKFINSSLFENNSVEEKNIEKYSKLDKNKKDKKDLINKNKIIIKNKNTNLNISVNKNIMYVKKEPIENKIYKDNKKIPFLKRNQSSPEYNREIKHEIHKNIKSSFIPNNIKSIINQINENFCKVKTQYLNIYENKNQTKKIFEFIFDDNNNAKFHFQRIQFGNGNQKRSKYQLYNNYTDNSNSNENKEEVIVKALGNHIFLNKNKKRKISYRNYFKFQKSATSRNSTEENKNNSNKINKGINENEKKLKIKEMKKFYKTKYDKFEIKNSILYLNENRKNINKYNKENLLRNKNNKNGNFKDKYEKISKFDIKKDNIIEKAPIIINKYISKRKKNNNDDIIALI